MLLWLATILVVCFFVFQFLACGDNENIEFFGLIAKICVVAAAVLLIIAGLSVM